jgi:hypothetical protein
VQVADINGLRELWLKTTGDPRIRIAVLDGPVDLHHPSLATSTLKNDDCASRTRGEGVLRHGTHIASLIFGQHSSPVKGVAPNCSGMILPIFDDVGSTSQVQLAYRINQAIEAKASIINISAGQLSESGVPHPLLESALQLCKKTRTLVVAAAGNEGSACAHVPGASPMVLVVGATDEYGQPTRFSNWSELYVSHGIVAPGVELLGAGLEGKLESQSGTSHAAAIVSGVAGLLLSMQLKNGRNPDPEAIRDLLLQTSDRRTIPGVSPRQLLAGRLNIAEAAKEGLKIMDDMSGDSLPPTLSHPPVESPVVPSSCGCGCSSGCGCSTVNRNNLIYALGTIGYDFGTEARRDSFVQRMKPGTNPLDPGALIDHLKEYPFDAASIIWTLNQEDTPIYAVQPEGPFARECFETLRQFLEQERAEGIERVSIPGKAGGSIRLSSGQSLQVVIPELRGMYSWTTKALVANIVGRAKQENTEKVESIRNFLDRVYFELQNLGIRPEDRALNFAATNAFSVAQIFENAIRDQMQLDTIGVNRSPLCRPESDCWDVTLYFFDPKRQLEKARKVYRFTVDVSDIVPVTIGRSRNWATR